MFGGNVPGNVRGNVRGECAGFMFGGNVRRECGVKSALRLKQHVKENSV